LFCYESVLTIRVTPGFDSNCIWFFKKSFSLLNLSELNYGMLQLVSEREFYLVLFI